MADRHFDDVTHDYRLAKAADSVDQTLKAVEAKLFNFGSVLIGKEDFDDEDGDTIANSCGGIPKDILMLMLRTGCEALRARLRERGIVFPGDDDG